MTPVKINSKWSPHPDGIGKQFKVTVTEANNKQVLSEVTLDFPRWQLHDLKQDTDFDQKKIEYQPA